jgi:hypothetical protein
MRGELCTFDHGVDRILVQDMNEFQKLNMEPAATPPVPPVPLPIPNAFPIAPTESEYIPQAKRIKFDGMTLLILAS